MAGDILRVINWTHTNPNVTDSDFVYVEPDQDGRAIMYLVAERDRYKAALEKVRDWERDGQAQDADPWFLLSDLGDIAKAALEQV